MNLNDVSILKEMPSVEILTLSVNSLNSLEHIPYCVNLSELYIRNNQIKDLKQIYYLKSLKNLKILWLADNECVNCENYRSTVLRNLPNLEKLDNATVTIEEIELSMREGELVDTPPKLGEEENETTVSSSELFNSIDFKNEINECIMPIADNEPINFNYKNIEELNTCKSIDDHLNGNNNEEEQDLCNSTINDSKVDTNQILEILKSSSETENDISDFKSRQITSNQENEKNKLLNDKNFIENKNEKEQKKEKISGISEFECQEIFKSKVSLD